MSSDIIVIRESPGSVEKSAFLSTKPFLDICAQVFEVASGRDKQTLAQRALNAKIDDYLDLHDVDSDALLLVSQVIQDFLANPNSFSWLSRWQQDPIFIAQCRQGNISPSSEAVRIREMTIQQLRRLDELLHEAALSRQTIT